MTFDQEKFKRQTVVKLSFKKQQFTVKKMLYFIYVNSSFFKNASELKSKLSFEKIKPFLKAFIFYCNFQ